ncbi:Uncharacterised protein [Vibrio cholerae]|nr:Uncharacterised protein [Vibrio cholerae]CSI47453.1 Uncharacterised protein [Vibrio cholerae]
MISSSLVPLSVKIVLLGLLIIVTSSRDGYQYLSSIA